MGSTPLRKRCRLGLSFAVWILGSVGAAGPCSATLPLDYRGAALKDSTRVLRVRDQIQLLLLPAAARAESLLHLPLDEARIKVALTDAVRGPRGMLGNMRTGGYDTVRIDVFVQHFFRESYVDTTEVPRVLAHEFVHAILRQHLGRENYSRLPNWFKEGMPTFLVGQHQEKLRSVLGKEWEHAEDLASGISRDHVGIAGPYLTGSWFFRAFCDRCGAGAIPELCANLVRDLDLSSALEMLGCPEGVVWAAAESLATREVQGLTKEAAEPLRKCMVLNKSGREKAAKCTKCFESLIRKYPGTYAAGFAQYWLAKSYYRRGFTADAIRCLDIFEAQFCDFTLRDDAQFMRLKLDQQAHGGRASRSLCDRYLRRWPDGDHIEEVKAMRSGS